MKEEEIIKKALEVKKLLKLYGHDYRHIDDLVLETKNLLKMIINREVKHGK